MTFWYGSRYRSADPYLWLPDPDPAVSQMTKKNLSKFLLNTFKATFKSFFKDKKGIKKTQYSRNQGFSYIVCLMLEGPGAGAGSVRRTYGIGIVEYLRKRLLNPLEGRS